MIKALALIAIALMTNGCVVAQRSQTPSYADVQAESLNQALQNGQISRSDYYARMNELQALAQQDQARRQQAAIAIYGQMQQQSRLQQQLQAQQQQKYLDSIRAIQQQQQTPSAPAGQSEWILQYNSMQNNWQYAPPGAKPRFNAMENRWEMVP